MIAINPEEFMRALAFARSVKTARPRENFYGHLIGRLGEIIFYHEVRRAVPVRYVGDLNWVALPKHVDGSGLDLRVRGWKVDVKTPTSAVTLDWPSCKRADLFPVVRLETECLKELSARYKNPARSQPIGLLDNPIIKVEGRVAGWIGIGSAEQLAGENVISSRHDNDLAAPAHLWTLLGAVAGPNIKLADEAWQRGRESSPAKARATRGAVKPAPVLMPPRRAARSGQAASVPAA